MQKILKILRYIGFVARLKIRIYCLFIMQNKEIKPMSELTNKELSQAHNLQKIYKAGAFDG